jgi:hypothetical protein
MGRRLALLIATYQYQDTGLRQLTAPAHDAEALATVLRDPAIAGFEVTTLINEPHHRVGEAIGDFYRDRRHDDLTLLYFTGHGLKDDDGRLYLAMTNTRRDGLLFTALPAEHVDQAMEGCVSRQKVLVLDCCYSGAFPAGRIAKADTAVHTLERFQGRGRTVLTASDATQYSFEGDRAQGEAPQSVFTRYLVAGLRDGSADLDGDGDITIDELYSYVHDRVVEEMPQQRPKKQDNVEGRTIIARNVNWTLPAYLRNAMESPIATDRLAVLDGLAHLHRIGNDTVRGAALEQIRRLADDDSKLVSAAATARLESLRARPPEPSAEVPPPQVPDPPQPTPPSEPARAPAPTPAPAPLADPRPAPASSPVAEPSPVPAPEHRDHAPDVAPVTTGGSRLMAGTRAKVLLAGAAALILAITIVIASLSDHHDSNGAEQHGALDQPRFVFSDQSGPLGDMAFSQDGRVLAAFVGGGTVKVWNVVTGASAGTLTGHADEDSNLALSRDGKVLAVSTTPAQGFATVRLWTVATGTLAATITGNGAAYSLAFSPDGGTLAIANTLAASKRYDNPIRLWDTATGQDAGELTGHTNGIETLAFSPDGKLLASGGSGQNPVRVWNVASRKLEATLKTDVATFAGALAFSDGNQTLVSMRGDVVQLWDVAHARLTATFTKNTVDVLAVGFGPGRVALAAGGGDPTVLWDVATKQPWRTLSIGDPSKGIAFGPDAKALATGDGNGDVRLWDIGSG